MNASTSWLRWPLALLALAMLAGCSGGRDVPDDYGATTERNFTEGCVTALTDDSSDGPTYDGDTAEGVCGCAYEEITSPSGLTYERFREINDSQEAAPTELPDELREIIDRCRPPEDGAGGG